MKKPAWKRTPPMPRHPPPRGCEWRLSEWGNMPPSSGVPYRKSAVAEVDGEREYVYVYKEWCAVEVRPPLWRRILNFFGMG